MKQQKIYKGIIPDDIEQVILNKSILERLLIDLLVKVELSSSESEAITEDYNPSNNEEKNNTTKMLTEYDKKIIHLFFKRVKISS